MDKGAKDTLVRSPRENGEGQDAQKDLHSRTGRDEKKGKTQEKWKEEVERDLQVLGVRRWRELVTDTKKWKDNVRQAKAHNGLYCQWKKKNTYYLETKTLKSLYKNSICGTCLFIYLAMCFPSLGTELFIFSITFPYVTLQYSKQNVVRLVAKCYVVGR